MSSTIAIEDYRPFVDCTGVTVKYDTTLSDYRERLMQRSSAPSGAVLKARLAIRSGLVFGIARPITSKGSRT